jgi:hypothetical protein
MRSRKKVKTAKVRRMKRKNDITDSPVVRVDDAVAYEY